MQGTYYFGQINKGGHMNGGKIFGYFGGSNIGALITDWVGGIDGNQPNIPVYARAWIPARIRLGRIINLYRYGIGAIKV